MKARDFLVADEDARILELSDHFLRVGDEVGRQVAAVELHSFDHVERRFGPFGLLDCDDAFLAYFFHRVGEHVADGRVAVGADCAHLGDGRLLLRRSRKLLDLGDYARHSRVNAPLELHGACARLDELDALGENALRQDGRGGRSIARLVARLRRDLAHHLCAHVFELVEKLDFLGDRHTVLGDDRRAVALFDDDVSAARTERHPNCVGEGIYPVQNCVACVAAVGDLFGGHWIVPVSS